MKKLVAVLLAGMMCVSLAACGGKKADETAADTTAAANTETTEAADGEFTTVADGVLTMGTNAAFPPYEYKEGDQIVGIDAEIAQALGRQAGTEA